MDGWTDGWMDEWKGRYCSMLLKTSSFGELGFFQSSSDYNLMASLRLKY